MPSSDEKIIALRSHANDVVERVVIMALARKSLRQPSVTLSDAHAPRLSAIERELRELKKVVESLAVRSMAQERPSHSFGSEGTTLLDAHAAYRLIDNPPEPNEALRKL